MRDVQQRFFEGKPGFPQGGPEFRHEDRTEGRPPVEVFHRRHHHKSGIRNFVQSYPQQSYDGNVFQSQERPEYYSNRYDDYGPERRHKGGGGFWGTFGKVALGVGGLCLANKAGLFGNFFNNLFGLNDKKSAERPRSEAQKVETTKIEPEKDKKEIPTLDTVVVSSKPEEKKAADKPVAKPATKTVTKSSVKPATTPAKTPVATPAKNTTGDCGTLSEIRGKISEIDNQINAQRGIINDSKVSDSDKAQAKKTLATLIGRKEYWCGQLNSKTTIPAKETSGVTIDKSGESGLKTD